MKEKTKDLLRVLAVSGGVGALAGLLYAAMYATQMRMVGINVPALDLLKGFGQNLLTVGAVTAGACVLSKRLDKTI